MREKDGLRAGVAEGVLQVGVTEGEGVVCRLRERSVRDRGKRLKFGLTSLGFGLREKGRWDLG